MGSQRFDSSAGCNATGTKTPVRSRAAIALARQGPRLAMAFFLLGSAAAAAAVKIELSPPNGASDVDPDTAELRIVFDVDMKTGQQSVCGGGETFPKLRGAPIWKNPRTLILKVKLEPEHEYQMSLNCPASNRYFRTTADEEIPFTPWSFTTAAKRSAGDQRTLNERSLDELMEALRDTYSYYDRRKIDWKAHVAKQRKKIVSSKSTRVWVQRVAKLLAAAEDPHLWINFGGTTTGTYQRKFTPNFNMKDVEAELGPLKKRNSNLFTAETGDGFVYLLIPSWGRDMKEQIEETRSVLAELKDAKALILDVRPNGGGDELLARSIAQCFVKGTHTYSKNCYRDGNAKGGFGPIVNREIKGNGKKERFSGPVAVLMGPANMSSCESFLLMMKQGEHVTLIGRRSAGSSGNPKPRLLENGVEVFIPSWKDLLPNGKSLEGKGIQPDIEVLPKRNDESKGDPVIRRAVKELTSKLKS